MNEGIERTSVPEVEDQNIAKPKKSKYTPALARAQKAYHQRKRAANWDCAEAMNEKDASEFVAELAQSKSNNVIDQCIRFGAQTAHDLGLTANQMYWSLGAARIRECQQADENISFTEIENGSARRSEVLSRRELYALFSFATAGRKILGTELSFQVWLDMRDRGRKDLFWLACDVLKIPLVEEVHREITENFYPKLDADGLYPPDYSLTAVHAAIRKQTDQREYLLLDPRGYMKTALASAFVVQFLLNFPDARVWDTSGTDDLALGFLRLVKIVLAKQTGADSSTFNLLYPEYTMHGINTESPNPITLPCRKHPQKDFSLWTAGVISASSGAHADLWLQDDVVQEEGSEVTREKLRNKLANLGNVPDSHALRIGLGTRYHEQDAYSYRLALLDDDPNAIKYLCRGVWTVKTGFGHVAIENLTLDQVDLLWPNQSGNPQRTFADLKRKLKLNKNDFMHQQMNSPLAEDDSDNRITFDPDILTAHIKPLQDFPKQGEDFMAVDVAYSQNAQRADFSVIVVGRIAPNPDTKRLSLYVLYVDAKRRRQSELAADMASAAQSFNPKLILLEKLTMHELLISTAQSQAAMKGYSLPIVYQAKIAIQKDAKFRRIKNLEILLNEDRLFISEGCGMLPLLQDQFCRYDGRPSSNKKHDDIPDAISLLAQHALPIDSQSDKDKEMMEAANESAQAAQGRAAMYSRIFGTNSVVQRPTTTVPEPINRGEFNIPGLRRPPLTPSPSNQIGFGSLRKTA